MVKNTENSINARSRSLLHPTGEGVVVDIGTGDGRFVYRCARRNPHRFYIGIDASPRALEKISRNIYRKPAKGGLPNALFLQATVRALPVELDGVADEVHIHFPWGSLLQGVATGDEAVMHSLWRICAPGALLEIIIALDPERDKSAIEALGLKLLTNQFLELTLIPRYEASGFEVLEAGTFAPSEWPEIDTSWAKRLSGSHGRLLIYVIAQAKTRSGEASPTLC